MRKNQSFKSIPLLLERAGAWFLSSGIQHEAGGVARYYRSDSEDNQRISTEITGYCASTLVYMHELTGDPAYLEAARRAGRFLTRVAWEKELRTFPFEYAGMNRDRSPAFFFDCGIIIRGLLSFWRATGEAEFLETARICGDSMADDFLDARIIHPALTLPDKQAMPHERRWSRSPGCYQLKSALAWHDLHTVTGNLELLDHYRNAAGFAIRSQRSFLPGASETSEVMDRLHAYCYFLEGLLPLAGEREYARILSDGIARIESLLREIAPVFERSDVHAQLLRLRLYADAGGILTLDKQAAELQVSRIQQFQLEHLDKRIDGGFCFGTKDGRFLPFINPVSTAFCVQALNMWRQYEAGEFQADISSLI